MSGAWVNDLSVGVRLAVGGGRTAMARLALSAIGIAIAAALLLVAASVGTMSDNRQQRSLIDMPFSDGPVAGVHPTRYLRAMTDYRGQRVVIHYVWSDRPGTPKPAGLPELPKPGQMYASPALAELLGSDAGAQLRPRLPDKIVGTLDKSMVLRPGYLTAWVGADRSIADGQYGQEIYSFTPDVSFGGADAGMLTLILAGAVLLLLPIFTFITSASRIAGAERDRRLSALRLVGAGRWQVRRIAAAESLVSAVVGLAAGCTIFGAGRLFADDIELFGESVYTSDVVPDPVLAVLLVLLIPTLAVLTALFALRRTIVEPLGVVRQSKPVRRRAWWRFTLVGLGVLLMLTQFGADKTSDTFSLILMTGVALLMMGMLAVLPWAVERLANRIKGGPPSVTLAIRRLQLDSGTSARVVSGVAVVLAGMIALQTMLLSVDGALVMPGKPRDGDPGVLETMSGQELTPKIQRKLADADGVLSTPAMLSTAAYLPEETDRSFTVAIVDCASLKELVGVRTCVDGDVFQPPAKYEPPPAPGTALEFRRFTGTGRNWDPTKYVVEGRWTVPAEVKHLKQATDTLLYGALYVTPGALGDFVPDGTSTVVATIDKDITADQLEGVRNALAEFRWQVYTYTFNTAPQLTADQQVYASIRTSLYMGSIFTLLLAGVSLLVLALEHIRERRRPLAILAASGVPKAVLGRSLLWQVALPIGIGVIMALVTGIGIAGLFMRQSGDPLRVDWPGVILLCAGAIALSLLVSAMTLPFLNRATRLTTIRTE